MAMKRIALIFILLGTLPTFNGCYYAPVAIAAAAASGGGGGGGMDGLALLGLTGGGSGSGGDTGTDGETGTDTGQGSETTIRALDGEETLQEDDSAEIDLTSLVENAVGTTTFSVKGSPAHGDLSDCSSGNCTYTPDTNFNGTDSFTFIVSDDSNESNMAEFTLTVENVLDSAGTLDYGADTSSTAGVGDSVTISSPIINGGTADVYSFSVPAPGLPDGLTMDPHTGAISGTAESACNDCVITVEATTVDGEVASIDLTFDINDIAPTGITLPTDADNNGIIDSVLTPGDDTGTGSATATDATGNVIFTETALTGSGGTDLSGLPHEISGLSDIGLSIDSATGAITGTPNYSGTFEITIKADNSATGGNTFSRIFTFTVDDPTISIADDSSSESIASHSLSITLSNESLNPVVVQWHTVDGSATVAGGDYTAVNTSGPDAGKKVTISAGSLSGNATVAVTNDSDYEGDESFSVIIDPTTTNVRGISDNTAEATIEDDDVPKIQFSVTSGSETEGDGSSVTHTITVVSDVAVPDAGGLTVNFSYSVAGITHTATPGTDFVSASPTSVVIPNGATSATFDVTINGDTIDEENEQFKVILSDGVSYNLNSNYIHTVTITDNDPTVVASIDDPSAVSENAGSITFTVTLDAASERVVKVDYATADSSATTADGDYTAKSATLTFNPGETTKTVNVTVHDDGKYENTEVFVVNTTAAQNVVISGTENQGVGQISNDDSAPVLSISDSSLTEGDGSPTNMSFTVTRTGETALPATFDYSLLDGSATGSSTCSATDGSDDYDHDGGSGSVPAGGATNTTTITVPVCGDGRVESTETFVLTLVDPGNASLHGTDYSATGSITDNDSLPTLSFTSTPVINNDNRTSYVVSGNCSVNGSTVDVNVGDVTDSPVCTGGTFTTSTMDVSGVTDSGSVSVTADLTDSSGNDADQAVTTVLKDTVNPTVSFTSTPAINHTNQTDYVVTGSCSENGRTVSVSVGGVTDSPVCTGGSFTTTSLDVSGLVDSSSISVTADLNDAAGNDASQATTAVVKDIIDPTVSIGSPSTTYAGVSSTITYPITYVGTTSVSLDSSDVILNISGAECSINVVNGTTSNPDVELYDCTGNGTVGISIAAGQGSDGGGNTDAGAGPSATFTVDTTYPVISGVSPVGGASVNSTLVSYSFSEICNSGSVTWTENGTSLDAGSPHVQSLTGSELNAGAHHDIILTHNPSLVDGATYDISFDCTDRAGNGASTVTSSSVSFTDAPLEIVSAKTVDRDGDGKIDAYRVAFNKNVKDNTFPGYSVNSSGSVTTDWLISGYTNVRLIHGSAVTWASDVVNDSVLYIGFDETLNACSAATQTGCDTGNKPDFTTTTDPGLQDAATNPINQVDTADVTEADGAMPILVTAKSLGATIVDVIFSEAMEQTEAENTANFSIADGITVTAATRDVTDYKTIHLIAGTQVGGEAYTLTVNTDVKDLANYNLSASANTAIFTGLVNPVVVSITTVNSTTLTITFNENVVASTAECTNTTACASIYTNTSLPVKNAVSTAGAGVNSNQFTLTVNDMVEGQSYTTTVLEDTVTSVSSGQKMAAINNSATFTGDGRPGVVVSTDTATACGAYGGKRVVVEYDQPVGASAMTLTNYRITQCESGSCTTGLAGGNQSGAVFITDEGGYKYAIDFAEVFNTSGDQYRMNISNVLDINGNAVATPTNLSFQCGNDTTGPVLIAADVISSDNTSTQIMLTFSEEVNQVTANNGNNYQHDSAGYGTHVYSSAKQTNPSQVLVTFQPYLSDGGHQISVRYVTDVAARPISGTVSTGSGSNGVIGSGTSFTTETETGARITINGQTQTVSGIGSDTSLNTAANWTITSSGQTATVTNVILANGTNNAQPIIVDAATGFDGGTVFEDPFGDGTKAGMIVNYDGKLYLGADWNSTKLFEVDYGLTSSQTITLDADGTPGAPIEDFYDYLSYYSGCSYGFPCNDEIKGVDTLYAACVGGTSSPEMTGSACTTAGGTDTLFIGALNVIGNYKSFWYTNDKTDTTTTFTFSEERNPDSGGGAAYRSTVFIVFKDQLWNHYGAELGGGGRGGRVCMKPGGCDDGKGYLSGVAYDDLNNVTRIGANGNPMKNGSQYTVLGSASGGGSHNKYLNAINILYEYDNDGAGSNESQLYMANGGVFDNYGVANGSDDLCSARVKYSDGGIVRSRLSYSTRSSLPPNCTGSGCATYWEDVTPDSNPDWSCYVSIPYPENSAVTGEANCSTSNVEMDCTAPYNIFIPAMKAIPYMKTAPNGDLYMLRNACDTKTVCYNGSPECDFRTEKQVCPKGHEIPQLWMLPQGTTGSPSVASDWELVAEYGSTGKTNMAGNVMDCDNSGSNLCEHNTHATLLEFVGDYIYIGFDNESFGANIWRASMEMVDSGDKPSESDFQMVNIPGLDGTVTNERLFSHVTVSDSGTDWLIVATRDGSNAMQLYRTANDQD